MCYVVIKSPYLPGDYFYWNKTVRNDLVSDLLWEYLRLFMLIGFIFNTAAGNLMLNELIHRLFFS